MSWWKFGNKKIENADFVDAFLLKNQKSIPAIRSLDQVEFTVFDTETTGLSVKEDYILSFGAIKIRNQAKLKQQQNSISIPQNPKKKLRPSMD
jgi:DNA polymerase III subunit epsilon